MAKLQALIPFKKRPDEKRKGEEQNNDNAPQNNENTPRVVYKDERIVCFDERGGVRCIKKPEEKRNYYTGYEGWQNAVDNSGHFKHKKKIDRQNV